MVYGTGFRGHGVCLGVESASSVLEKFWEALRSGLSPTAAATVAGVSGTTGRKWANTARYQSGSKHYGIRYSPQVRAVFWEALRSGATPMHAAMTAGASSAAARRWIQQAGYVPRTPFPAGVKLAAPSRGCVVVSGAVPPRPYGGWGLRSHVNVPSPTAIEIE
jgi:transposase, IS30 family